MPTLFRHRPSGHWTDGSELKWDKAYRVPIVAVLKMEGDFQVSNDRGDVKRGNPGDYLVRDEDGRLSVVSPAVYAEAFSDKNDIEEMVEALVKDALKKKPGRRKKNAKVKAA